MGFEHIVDSDGCAAAPLRRVVSLWHLPYVRSHQKSQGHDILALGLIWAKLKHDEAWFSKFWEGGGDPHTVQCKKSFFVCFFENLSHYNTHDYDILTKWIYRDKKCGKTIFPKKITFLGGSHVWDKNTTFLFFIAAKLFSACFRPKQTKPIIEVLTFFVGGGGGGVKMDHVMCDWCFAGGGTDQWTTRSEIGILSWFHPLTVEHATCDWWTALQVMGPAYTYKT